MQEKALELATHITHPVTVAAFALVIAAILFASATKFKRTRLAWLLGVAIIVLGLAPLAASTYLQSRGIYRVRVVVLGPDHQPVPDAAVTSSLGGEIKKANGSWEFDIPPQTRPADGKVVLFAAISSSFQTGKSTLVLGDDYYPTATIQLAADTSAVVRGVVLDGRGRSVAGAYVSIPGYEDRVVTSEMGSFVLPAHAAEGQMVQIRAQKGDLVAEMYATAGKNTVELVIRRR